MSESLQSSSPQGGQPLLFAELPESVNAGGHRRRRLRKSNDDALNDMCHSVPSPIVIVKTADPAPLDPAALTQGELRAIAEALPDAKLAFLVVEAARAIKKRLVPIDSNEEIECSGEPNPVLLRALSAAAAELSGEDDMGQPLIRPDRRGVGKGPAINRRRLE